MRGHVRSKPMQGIRNKEENRDVTLRQRNAKDEIKVVLRSQRSRLGSGDNRHAIKLQYKDRNGEQGHGGRCSGYAIKGRACMKRVPG